MSVVRSREFVCISEVIEIPMLKINRCFAICPFYGGCPYLGGSIKRGSTVVQYTSKGH